MREPVAPFKAACASASGPSDSPTAAAAPAAMSLSSDGRSGGSSPAPRESSKMPRSCAYLHISNTKRNVVAISCMHVNSN